MNNEKRILIIDDEQRMADSLCDLLKNEGYQAVAAYDGKGGIERLKETKFQVVITDLRMADVTGSDIMHFIHTKMPETLIIIITGHASTESAIEAIHYDAFDYITKPFNFDLLLSSVEKAFLKIEAEQLREEMIHMITHDIKLPLTSIIGYSSMLYDRKNDQISDKAREYANSIYLNSQKLLSLVDNFLTSCKIDAGRLGICEVDVELNNLVQDLLLVVTIAARKKDIEVTLNLSDDLPLIKADENLMFRAVGNIINNAVKYTPSGGLITVTTETAKKSESPIHKPSVVVSISNTGPGIPQDELQGIFDRYERTEGSRGIEGSGIGLYVVKSVVNAHEGMVTVDSVPGTLTTFAIWMPAKTP